MGEGGEGETVRAEEGRRGSCPVLDLNSRLNRGASRTCVVNRGLGGGLLFWNVASRTLPVDVPSDVAASEPHISFGTHWVSFYVETAISEVTSDARREGRDSCCNSRSGHFASPKGRGGDGGERRREIKATSN